MVFLLQKYVGNCVFRPRGDGGKLIASSSQAEGPGFDPRSRQIKVWSPSPPIPRLQVAMMCLGSPPQKKRGHVGMVQAECQEAPGMTGKNLFF